MAEYTMELRTILENDINIFDFEYPIFKEEYRQEFEKKFKEYFYFREIGSETVGRFIFNLKQHLNLIMPYYNKLYNSQSLEQRILDNYDVTETYDRTTQNKDTLTGENKNLNSFTNTPMKRVDIANIDYVSNIDKNEGTNKNINEGNGTEQWIRTMKGNIGIQTDADAIKKYEASLRLIDLEVFIDCEILFMGVF